ncbi:McrC family protein [Terasakiella pusilla]|uniref:McrC family protein n=1 Tax=Terasakiella pusilla TaxID=64973 RepID=UPI003AA7B133
MTYGPGEGQIPPWAADRLAAVAQQSQFAGKTGNGVLEHGRYALRVKDVVGILAAEECCLEILPKLDLGQSAETLEDQTSIRQQLIHMLEVVLKLKIDSGAMTGLSLQRETLLEILIRAFVVKLADAVRSGMPRRYCAHEEDLSALRGKLDVTKQFTIHAFNPSRLACRFDDLSENILLNKVVKAAIIMLMAVSRSCENQKYLRELSFVYADIPNILARNVNWNELVLDRTNRKWHDVIEISRLFLSGHFQTTSSGQSKGVSLLFKMNLLFEEYMGCLFAKALNDSTSQLILQGGRKYCLTDTETDRKLFQTKPDMIISDCTGERHVIDTKWKTIVPREENLKQGADEADIYQMMSYAHVYDADRVTLLYPHHDGLNGEGIQSRYRIAKKDVIIEIATFDIRKRSGDQIDRIRRLLLGKKNSSTSEESIPG